VRTRRHAGRAGRGDQCPASGADDRTRRERTNGGRRQTCRANDGAAVVVRPTAPGVFVIQLVTTDGSRLVTFGVAGQLWDDPASQYR